MADLSVTAASVKKGTGAKTKTGTAGATITAGQVLYMDSNDADKLKLADSNASLATAIIVGIAMHGASNNQPLEYCYEGKINIGATVGVGTVYVTSGTAGGIALGCPGTTDLATGMYTSVVGMGLLGTTGGADDNFLVVCKNARVAVP